MWIYDIHLDGLARRLQNSPEKSTAKYVRSDPYQQH